MVEDLYPKGIQWHLVRMLSIDGLEVRILLVGDDTPRGYKFENREQMDRVMLAWFGKHWTGEESESRPTSGRLRYNPAH